MKTITLFLVLCGLSFGGFFAQAQQLPSDCENDPNRYLDRNWADSVSKSPEINFGENTQVGGVGQQQLDMYFYEPFGDTVAERPLIILAFGGSFISGNKNDVDGLCRTYAKMGYCAAAIDYRTGLFVPNQVTTTLAVMRAMHDMKAAVRYFYKDAQTSNTHRIDTNRIIVGGVSAGAITAIHTAYLNEDSEIPAYMANDTAGLGGVSGLSGNPGYSEDVIAVVSYSGTIGDSAWILPNDDPIISFHETGDNVVPYGTEEVAVSGIPTGLVADGSGSIHEHCDNVGTVNKLITYNRSGHVGYLGTEYDETIDTTKVFLYNNATCKTIQSVGITSIPALQENITVQPNPASGQVSLQWDNHNSVAATANIYNQMGQLVLQQDMEAAATQLDISSLAKGLYILDIRSRNKQELLATKKLVVQ